MIAESAGTNFRTLISLSVHESYFYHRLLMLLLNIPDFFHHLFEDPQSLYEPEKLIRYGGLIVLFLMVFLQTGVFFFFFLPGDALIFASGVLITTGDFKSNPLEVMTLLMLSAIAGSITGYWFGRKTGPLLLKRQDSFFFKKDYVDAAEEFYTKYRGWALVIGLFLPIIRTFSPVIVGVIKLDFKKFLFYVVLGAVSWIGSLFLLGYFLGSITWVQKNIHIIALALILVITIPVIVRLYIGIRRVRTQINRNP